MPRRTRSRHYARLLNSVFGPATEFVVLLRGKPEHQTFALQGEVEGRPDMQLLAYLTRQEELPR
jgi:hypothetical protein